MQKHLRLTLALLLALCVTLGVGTAYAQGEADRTYIGFVTNEAYPDVVVDRIHAVTIHDGRTWLALPTGAPAASDFYGNAVRFVLDAPQGGLFDSEAILTPASVELVPAVMGGVAEFGDEYVVINIYADGAKVDDAPTTRLTITADSVISQPLKLGDLVYAAYDAATNTIVALMVTNG